MTLRRVCFYRPLSFLSPPSLLRLVPRLDIGILLRTIDILSSDPRAPGVHRHLSTTTTSRKTAVRLLTEPIERKLMSIFTSMSSQKRSATKTLNVKLHLELL